MEAVAEPIVECICGKLLSSAGDCIQTSVVNAWDLENQLTNLETDLPSVQSKLADAEKNQGEDVEAAKRRRWFEELKEVVYEAENVIDEFNYEKLRQQVQQGVAHKVRNFFYPILYRLNLGRKLNNIQKRIKKTETELAKLPSQPQSSSTISSVTNETCSSVNESNVFGRKELKNQIVNVLIHDELKNNKVTVLSIVGMGGIGKSTLAQLIYNDPQVKEHFKEDDQCHRRWVCVSETWDMKKIMRGITKEEFNSPPSFEDLHRALEKALTNKRYLIVLDNIWNEDKTKWDDLKVMLDYGGQGSVIIVTTRSKKASEVMGVEPLQTYSLSPLSEDESWKLFTSKAFAPGAKIPEELVDIGKEITKRCGGLPLALRMIGSLLYEESDIRKWEKIKESPIWNMETQILPALQLSYKHLPLCSKRCFTFCAVFPKDYLMRKDELINTWMAHGFIPSDGSLEDKGHEIFNQLVQRSFLHDLHELRGTFDMFTAYRMHDLIHDLAQSIVGENEYVTQLEKFPKDEEALRKVYHLSISGSMPNNELSVNAFPNLRTLFILSDNLIEEDMDFSQSTFLRVLRLQGLNCTGLSNSLKTQHLRYLNLSLTSVSYLPESICTMLQLQILDLSYCGCLKELPKRMRHLISLRHLYLRGCDELKGMPAGMGRLTNLRTLTNYILAPGDNNAGNGIGQLNGLQLLLPYQLVLCGLNYWKKSIETIEVILHSKENLSLLIVEWRRGIDGRELLSDKVKENEEKVLNELRPPRGIEFLKIVDYSVLNLPAWIADSVLLPKLVQLYLVDCPNLHHLPPIWKLKSLQVLELASNNELKFIISDWNNERDTSCQAFPSLKKLNLRHLKSLQGWCENNAKLTMPLKLESLMIIACHTLTTMPNCPASLKYLHIQGCSELVALGTEEEQKLSHLTSLEHIEISDCQRLKYLPSGTEGLTALRRLKIEGCGQLTSLPTGLTSLEYLRISRCPSLKYLISGMEGLTAPRRLEIISCKQLKSLPKGLTALDSLKIWSCHHLMSLPQGLTALRSLEINSCNHLMSLPEGLTALDSLKIWSCHRLMSLPEGLTALLSLEIISCNQLKSLPEGLTALHSLKIWSCHQLMLLPEDLLQRLSTITIGGGLRIEECPELEKKYGHLLKRRQNLNRIIELPEDLLQRLSTIGGGLEIKRP